MAIYVFLKGNVLLDKSTKSRMPSVNKQDISNILNDFGSQ